MPTFIKDLVTIQGIFYRSVKIDSTSTHASTCMSVSKALKCHIMNLTYLACYYDDFYKGIKIMHRKTNVDADEGLSIH